MDTLSSVEYDMKSTLVNTYSPRGAKDLKTTNDHLPTIDIYDYIQRLLYSYIQAHIKSQAVITNHFKQIKFDATNKTKKIDFSSCYAKPNFHL